MDLDTFFSKCRVKSGEYTHTGLGNPLGKFNITDLDTFYKLYNQALNSKVDLHLTECHTYTKKGNKYGPVVIDIDLKFKEPLKRQYTENDVKTLVKLYTEEYQKYLNPEKNKVYKAFIFQRDKPYLKSESETKDGIHIIFPFLITKGKVDYIVRKNIIDKLKESPELFNIKGNVNSLEETIDKAVISKNNWLMYGSKKPRCAPYNLTKVYKMTKEYPVKMFSDMDLSQLFSIRNANIKDIIPVKDKSTIKMLFSDPYFKDSISKKRIPKLAKNVPYLSPNELEMVKEITKLLSSRRATEHDLWIRVGWCLKNIGPEQLEDTFVEFRSKSLKGTFTEEKARNEFSELAIREDGYNLTNLKIWANEDNPSSYQKITSSMLKDSFQKGLSCTHLDLAKVIKEMYKEQFVCVDIEKKIWYQFKEHRWHLKMRGHSLWTNITTTITNEYMDMAKGYNTYIKDSQDPGNFAVQQAIKVATQLKNNSFLNNVLSVCAHEFYDEAFEERLNTKTHLICFENGVFDFNTKEFRDGRPDDFISFTTGTNYIEIDKSDTEYQQMKNFFRQIFPLKNKRKYVFRLLGSTLHGDIMYELFHFWTGKGGNGKTTLFNFLEMALGMYYGKLPSTFWTGKNAESGKAQPELFATKYRRLVVSEEMEENAVLNSSNVKYQTGGDSVTCRGMYKEQITFVPQAKHHVQCNELPNITTVDGGTWRRIRCIECTSRFVQNPNPANKNEFPVDFSLKAKMRKWVPIFASYLVKQCVSFLNENGLPKCNEVELFTKQYQADVNFIEEFMQFCVKESAGSYTMIMNVRKVFSNWWKMNKAPAKSPNYTLITNALSERYSKHPRKGFEGIVVELDINIKSSDEAED